MNVSVIIPAWNAEETLAATLDSLRAQTHPSWEAVIVDDGSDDDTVRIAQRYQEGDDRVRLVHHDHGGEAAARNRGLVDARYEWLLFLDSDDWIAPEYLARMTGELASDPGLDAVHCGYARVALDGTHIVDPYRPPIGDMFETWARRSAFPVHACVVRSALVREVLGFDPSLEKSADWDMWQRVARTGARFGAVRETLAFYRMRPYSASLSAPQMLRDGLTVLRRGHGPDPRVPRPHPDHAAGASPEGVRTQAWYLVSWCAGLLIGREEDARPLIDMCDVGPFPDLYGPAVGQAIWDGAPLSLCRTWRVWEELWPRVHDGVHQFLVALEAATCAPDLARIASSVLLRRVLRLSPSLASAADELDTLDARCTDGEGAVAWRDQRIRELDEALAERDRRIPEVEASLAERDAVIDERSQRVRELEEALAEHGEEVQELEGALTQRLKRMREIDQFLTQRDVQIPKLKDRVAQLEKETRALGEERDHLASANAALESSLERRVGDLLVNRLRLRGLLLAGAGLARSLGQRLGLARLTLDRWLHPGRRRLMTTVCWNFPIHSQTFVYQELTHLMQHGFAVRIAYSKLEPRDQLPGQYAPLWPLRRRLFLDRARHKRDYTHYRRRMAGRVDELIERVCTASGLSKEELTQQGNFLEAFTFTRMVEAYRPHYIHSYFFYDRSFMALVAAYLLELPRGVSCYADHVLDDYELKVVPLHMELCDVVIATSERIRRELMELAPQADPEKILVKPNGIDPTRFPATEHPAPANGDPFRLVSVCRIEPKKGLLDLVEAVHLLRERGRHVEAHIVGEADAWSSASVDYERRIKERVSELNLWGTVHLEGRQNLDGVRRFHQLGHVFVAPFVETESGDKDGIPTALLEGMSGGLPAVATDAGSIPEVLDDGRDGLVVPEGQPGSLADAIETLMSDPERRTEMGKNAAATVRQRFAADDLERLFHDRIDAVLRR